MRWLSVIALVALISVLYCPTLVGAGSGLWILVSSRVSHSTVLFDFDGDGLPEQLYLDGYAIAEPGVEVRTDGVPVKAGYPGLGICLYIYKPVTGSLSGVCRGFRAELPAPANETLRAYSAGLVVGDVAVVGLKAYYSPQARRGAVLLVEGKPTVLGVENSRLVLHYLETGVVEYVADLNVTVYAAVYDSATDTVYAVATYGRTLLLLRYNALTRVFTYEPLPVVLVKQVFSTTRSLYILAGDNVLYRVKLRETRLEPVAPGYSVFYPADSVDSFTLLGSGELVKIEERGERLETRSYPLLTLKAVYAADWWDPILAVAGENGVYLASLQPLSVSVNAPLRVYAGEEFAVSVKGEYASVYLLVGKTTYTSSGDFTVNLSLPAGVYTVKAVACRGVYCTTLEGSVTVERRPVRISAHYPEKAKPYERLVVLVEVFDVVANASIGVACTIRDPERRVNVAFESGKPVEVSAIPFDVKALFTVECLGGEYYENAETVVAVHLTEPYLAVNISMEKPGLLGIQGYDVYTGEPWRGLVTVEVDGVRFAGGGVVKVTLKPGRSLLRVTLARNNVVVFEREYEVYYYHELLYETATVTIKETRALLVTVTTPVETRAVEPLILAVVALFSAGATYALMVLIARRARIAKRG